RAVCDREGDFLDLIATAKSSKAKPLARALRSAHRHFRLVDHRVPSGLSGHRVSQGQMAEAALDAD
ncbi:MAG: hypothetical protein OXB95_08910, partial [Rhodobacteraceae bacterium]|nr:hypothetical protein [Paracoccaceae bacterium]